MHGIKKSLKLGILVVLPLLFASCNKKISRITITELTGRGYFASHMTRLQFSVTLTGANEVGGTITDWTVQIKDGNMVVIEVKKSVSNWVHQYITPAPNTTYAIAGNGTFKFSCFYDKALGENDIYAPYSPNTVTVTVTVQDDNDFTYTLTNTASFSFYRI